MFYADMQKIFKFFVGNDFGVHLKIKYLGG